MSHESIASAFTKVVIRRNLKEKYEGIGRELLFSGKLSNMCPVPLMKILA